MFRSSLVRRMAVSSLGLTMATAWSQDFPTPPLIVAVDVSVTTTLVVVSYLQPQMQDSVTLENANANAKNGKFQANKFNFFNDCFLI